MQVAAEGEGMQVAAEFDDVQRFLNLWGAAH